LLIPALVDYFSPNVIERSTDEELRCSAWFDFEGVPLKWHWPVGIIYDYHTAWTRLQGSSREQYGTWKISLHFTEYPSEELIPVPEDLVLQDYLINAVKEVYLL
jgi:autophagy-related protein 5